MTLGAGKELKKLIVLLGWIGTRPMKLATRLGHMEKFFTIDAEATRVISEKVRLFVAFQNLTGSRYEISSTPVFTLGPPVLVRGGLRVMLK